MSNQYPMHRPLLKDKWHSFHINQHCKISQSQKASPLSELTLSLASVTPVKLDYIYVLLFPPPSELFVSLASVTPIRFNLVDVLLFPPPSELIVSLALVISIRFDWDNLLYPAPSCQAWLSLSLVPPLNLHNHLIINKLKCKVLGMININYS